MSAIEGNMDMRKYFPKRVADETKVRPWTGTLFDDLKSPLMWKQDGYYQMLEPPKSVTFPICGGCGVIIWNWPHFEEEVPDNAWCDDCAREDAEMSG